jgi:nicotinate phosphoribosyltransferase
MAGDLIALVGEAAPGEPVLQHVMTGGHRVAPQPSLEQARQHLRSQLDALPAALKALDAQPSYPVAVSDGLRALAAEVDRWIATEATRDP